MSARLRLHGLPLVHRDAEEHHRNAGKRSGAIARDERQRIRAAGNDDVGPTLRILLPQILRERGFVCIVVEVRTVEEFGKELDGPFFRSNDSVAQRLICLEVGRQQAVIREDHQYGARLCTERGRNRRRGEERNCHTQPRPCGETRCEVGLRHRCPRRSRRPRILPPGLAASGVAVLRHRVRSVRRREVAGLLPRSAQHLGARVPDACDLIIRTAANRSRLSRLVGNRAQRFARDDVSSVSRTYSCVAPLERSSSMNLSIVSRSASRG